MVKIALDPAMYHNELSVADEHCVGRRPPVAASPVPTVSTCVPDSAIWAADTTGLADSARIIMLWLGDGSVRHCVGVGWRPGCRSGNLRRVRGCRSRTSPP